MIDRSFFLSVFCFNEHIKEGKGYLKLGKYVVL